MAGGAAATYYLLKKRKYREQKVSIRRWECVQVSHHNEIGRKIEEWESNGWILYSYSAASFQSTAIKHYLLFMKED